MGFDFGHDIRFAAPNNFMIPGSWSFEGLRGAGVFDAVGLSPAAGGTTDVFGREMSVPQAFGLEGAFRLARGMHAAMIGMLVWLTVLFGLGVVAWVGIGIVTLLLTYEHLIVSPRDLKRMNAAL